MYGGRNGGSKAQSSNPVISELKDKLPNTNSSKSSNRINGRRIPSPPAQETALASPASCSGARPPPPSPPARCLSSSLSFAATPLDTIRRGNGRGSSGSNNVTPPTSTPASISPSSSPASCSGTRPPPPSPPVRCLISSLNFAAPPLDTSNIRSSTGSNTVTSPSSALPASIFPSSVPASCSGTRPPPPSPPARCLISSLTFAAPPLDTSNSRGSTGSNTVTSPSAAPAASISPSSVPASCSGTRPPPPSPPARCLISSLNFAAPPLDASNIRNSTGSNKVTPPSTPPASIYPPSAPASIISSTRCRSLPPLAATTIPPASSTRNDSEKRPWSCRIRSAMRSSSRRGRRSSSSSSNSGGSSSSSSSRIAEISETETASPPPPRTSCQPLEGKEADETAGISIEGHVTGERKHVGGVGGGSRIGSSGSTCSSTNSGGSSGTSDSAPPNVRGTTVAATTAATTTAAAAAAAAASRGSITNIVSTLRSHGWGTLDDPPPLVEHGKVASLISRWEDAPPPPYPARCSSNPPAAGGGVDSKVATLIAKWAGSVAAAAAAQKEDVVSSSGSSSKNKPICGTSSSTTTAALVGKLHDQGWGTSVVAFPLARSSPADHASSPPPPIDRSCSIISTTSCSKYGNVAIMISRFDSPSAGAPRARCSISVDGEVTVMLSK